MPIETLKYTSTVLSNFSNIERVENDDDSKALGELNDNFIIELNNLTSNIASINSVQVKVGGNCTLGAAVAVFAVEILDENNNVTFSAEN